MTSATDQTHRYECACKGVQVQVTGTPLFQGYCHCVNCREWYQKSPLPFAVYPKDSVQVTNGSENVSKVSLVDPELERLFCSKCGYRINTQHAKAGVQVVNLFNLDSFDFKPIGHIFCKDAYKHNLKQFKDDALPKWRLAPPLFGGPDEELRCDASA